LTLDAALCDLARLKSTDMFKNNYFAHTSPTLGSAADMLRSHGYSFTSVGENIAHHSTVEKSQAAFMSSTGHRQNILGSQWAKVGIGVSYDSQGFVYVTQLFVR
ncbi:MAG: CAP domain-containing protein, partial [Clostridia bacterium]